MASAMVLLHAIFVEPLFWLLLRLGTGCCLAAVQMIIESWLNETATNATRGRVLSIYRITDFMTVTLTQTAIALFDPQQFFVFALISITFSLSLVPVALTRIKTPAVPTTAKLDLKRVWAVSPLAVAGALGVGLTASSFWSMTPVFVSEAGYGGAVTGYFIGAIILGGAVAQWPIGSLSDKMDRRRVIIGAALGATITACLIPVASMHSQTLLIVSGLTFGAFALPGFGLANCPCQ